MSIIKSTPDILYIDLRVISKNSNMGPQSMCSTMKIMDYARLDICQNPVRKQFSKMHVTSLQCHNARVNTITMLPCI